jgi:hypothetical protein
MPPSTATRRGVAQHRWGHTFTVVNQGSHLPLTQGWYDNASPVDPTNSNALRGGCPAVEEHERWFFFPSTALTLTTM